MSPITKSLPRAEFISLMAMLMATIAFSLDAMLPSMPYMIEDLSPPTPESIQLVLTVFVLGMGLGTFIVGPVSDAVGRRPVIVYGAVIYCVSAFFAAISTSFEAILIARLIQGLGAAGPRVVALAVVRDLYKGREMAQITSLIIMVFTLVPVFAPTLGAAISITLSWRAVFAACALFSIISIAWYLLRQPETLPPEARRPLRVKALLSATKEIALHTHVRRATIVLALCFGNLFIVLSASQMVFDQSLGLGDTFHLWFGMIAVFAVGGPILNSKIVLHMGMRRVVLGALLGLLVLTGLYLVALETGFIPPNVIWAYVLWQIVVFFSAGMLMGNLNAVALTPMGHIAGMAATIVSAVATVGSMAIAMPLAARFDGTQIPIVEGIFGCTVIAFLLATRLEDDQVVGEAKA
ncbi:MAG: multidrug effflux MFS transporter [Mangrovicoccus sp.]